MTPNQDIAFIQCDSPLKQGSYRGLAATANTFARESAMDELAAGLDLDPLEFRLRNLKEPCAAGGSRRNTDHRHRPSNRQCNIRRNRETNEIHADGPR
ncbi:MAG TPA: molybdopterin cofactor-binding domain-containing protein [Bryobacteraceae bacterium]|nr:molybdopterin cofactor-binding domain-containing protein [Bryobacteraceae bacterium]